ncbi:hemerythrin domain-containing protein [Bailinhaonella thermotolerans]|uniref:Hemerythrin domain-containing protein n=1 Tax=Bailinhaonella thermotolerans TaxID=1070861 RepID=A0A3A4B3I3_9ACTN|nr:hemerythrin domain-containing protein [Bailinhaonella thermotolerans]RJL32589.1 hemerythrin domain-containing protein [Bailinhaonella thermotolerans]
MGFKLDMTMMFVMHDALRRELERIARITERGGDDPRLIMKSAVGWEMFKRYLHAHHRAEDEALWPVMTELVAGRPDDLALLEAMEAEHARIDPLLEAIDAALADRETGPARLGALVDELRAGLTGHLVHEETDALPLIDAVLGEEHWKGMAEAQRRRVGDDGPRYLPWLLDDLDPRRAELVLGLMPAPIRAAYEDELRPAYAALDLWPSRTAA